jgi:hypothetical protein
VKDETTKNMSFLSPMEQAARTLSLERAAKNGVGTLSLGGRYRNDVG